MNDRRVGSRILTRIVPHAMSRLWSVAGLLKADAGAGEANRAATPSTASGAAQRVAVRRSSATKASGFGGQTRVLPEPLWHGDISKQPKAPGAYADTADASLRSLGLP